MFEDKGAVICFIILLLILLIGMLLCWYFVGMLTYSSSSYTPKTIIEKRYNIAIITLETRDLPIVDIHNRSLEAYADLCDYDYIFMKQYHNELQLPVYWKKLQVVRDLLPFYDYVLWLDSDTIIKRGEILLDYMIISSGEADILIGRDYPGTVHNTYNAGVFMIKNSLKGKSFIDECINTYIKRKECYNEDGKLCVKGEWAGKCYEQGVMNELIEKKYEVYTIPHHFVVSDVKMEHHTVILHCYGNKETAYKNFLSFYEQVNIFALPLYINPTPLKIAILLTFLNKREIYEAVLDKWIEETSFDIFVVSLPGINLDMEAEGVYFYTFTEPLQSDSSLSEAPSLLEARSILKAYEYFQEQWKEYDIIFKVTGDYTLPDFESLTESIPSNTDFAVQYLTITHGQNCEYFGIRPSLILPFFSEVNQHTTMEQRLRYIINLPEYKVVRFPLIDLETPVTQRDGSKLSYL